MTVADSNRTNDGPLRAIEHYFRADMPIRNAIGDQFALDVRAVTVFAKAVAQQSAEAGFSASMPHRLVRPA
jgi:hypothetical protein